MESFVALLIIAGIVVYFIPTISAATQDHRNVTAIFVLNLFLGWMLIGWVVALV